MNITFFETVQNYGGATVAMLSLANRLRETHEITIIDCYGSCVPFINMCNDMHLNLKIIDKRDKPYIINASQKKIFNIINALRYIPQMLILRKKSQLALLRINPDFIIINNSKTLSIINKNKTRARIVYYVHAWCVETNYAIFNRWLYKRNVDRFICVSQATKQALFQNGITTLDNLFVVHNSVDESTLSINTTSCDQSKDEDCIHILHAGGFTRGKGFHISVEIAKALNEKGVNFKLILAGIVYAGKESPEYLSLIKALIDTYSLEEKIDLVINNYKIMDYYRDCDILIHPSDSEGLPLVIMEAMALKKPVIANAVGGVIDYILDGFTGMLPRHNCVCDYVDCILKLKMDKDYYDYIANNAYTLITKTFTYENQTNSFNKALR